MKKATAVLLTVLCLFAALALAGCGESNNSPIVGGWKPSTVSIGGTSISYSDLETKDKEFAERIRPQMEALPHEWKVLDLAVDRRGARVYWNK